ncbi:HTH-type transcriptional regulator MalT [Salinispirillum sp. LH 10-3-1]|uniref:HTH-type transcriptional regulator MalT n=1 Tax=Salinispirillum sp. LH 10-3-1 TaxID=2952525 RepID=A0AB38YDV0_9GAMM
MATDVTTRLWVNPYKLIPPRIPEPVVARPRLEALLDQAWSYPVTLLQGPPGQGKTTLLVSWLHRRQPQYAWLSLDSGDNQVQHFAAHLLAALHQATANGCTESIALVETGEFKSLESLLGKVSVELSRTSSHLYVVLDDYHVINNPDIHAAMRHWVRYLPPNIHLLIGSHLEPSIGIAALRVRGQVLEVDAPVLDFTAAEAGEFLSRRLAREVTPDVVQQLENRLHGWPAGYQLISCHASTTAELVDSSVRLSGPYHLIFDYFRDEVMPSLAPALQHLLRRICVFDRFNADMCRHMTEQDDVTPWLSQLVHAHMLVPPTNEQDTWYRLHDLFREALRSWEQDDPIAWARIQARAVEAYLQTGQAYDALALALSMRDAAAIGTVLRHSGEYFYRRGQFDLLESAFELITETTMLEDSTLLLLKLWLNLATYREGDIVPLLATAEAVGMDISTELRAEFQVVRAQEAINREDYATARSLAREALDDLPADSAISRTVAWSVLGQSDLCAGRLKEALASLRAAEQQAIASKLAQQQLWSLCLQSDTHCAMGQLDEAFHVQTRAVATAHEKCIERVLHMEFLYRNRAQALLERLALDEALHFVEEELSIMQPLGDYGLLPAFSIKGRVHLVTGELTRARQVAFHLRHLKSRFNYHTDWLAHLLQFELVLRHETGEGDWPAIDESIVARAAENHFLQNYQRQVAWLRILRGEPAAGIALLKTLLQQADTCGLRLEALRTRLCLAAYDAAGARWLEPVRHELLQIKPLFTLWVWRDALRPLSAELPELGMVLPQVDKVTHHTLEVPPTGTPWVSRLNANLQRQSEALTPKEVEVLTRIVEGYTNQDIARQMFVAPTTVKSHIRSIYRKMNVNDRAEAIAFARPYFRVEH